MKEKEEVEEDSHLKILELVKNNLKYIIISAVLIIALIISIIVLSYFNNLDDSAKITICGDGTLHGDCSLRKPYFCAEGKLVERASLCECPEGLSQEENLCISRYQTNPKNITLNYILRGEKKEINFTVYEGMVNYISELPKSILYLEGSNKSRADFKLRDINEKEQRNLLLPLITKIQNIEKNKEEQVRIAISIVQNIPYGNSEKIVNVKSTKLNYSRYPYEVLYDMQGVCGEKTELLAFLLKEIGYGIRLFYNSQENHESLGIKCPLEHSFFESGYCFIETTGPSIITDSQITYAGGLKLSSVPEIIPLFEGDSLGDDLYEYKDAEDWMNIRNKLEQDDGLKVFDNIKKNKLIEKYGLVEVYNV